jgi:hypothetical protein
MKNEKTKEHRITNTIIGMSVILLLAVISPIILKIIINNSSEAQIVSSSDLFESYARFFTIVSAIFVASAVLFGFLVKKQIDDIKREIKAEIKDKYDDYNEKYKSMCDMYRNFEDMYSGIADISLNESSAEDRRPNAEEMAIMVDSELEDQPTAGE